MGSAKRVAMADLRTLVAELGYGDVQTLLNSGNVLFRGAPGKASAAAAAIEQAMAARLGVSARVTVIDRDDLDAIMAANSLAGDTGDFARLMVFVLNETASDAAALAGLHALAGQAWTGERLLIGKRAAYLLFEKSVLDSKAAAALGKLLGDRVTARNWNTMCKLQGLCAS